MARRNKLRVCVIGAGVCGLGSVKTCLEAGFSVNCYEKAPNYGGLWHYHDDEPSEDGDFIPSVMKTTILNTSKELSAFSDFPPASNLPNYMRHDLYFDYIKKYVSHFKLEPHLSLRHEVLRCEPGIDEHSQQVSWRVEVMDLLNNVCFSKKFDKLMVATGHHNIPNEPKFKGQEKFSGDIIHSVRLKNILQDHRFIDKRVLVIGFANSACDAANDIALVSKRCYLSSHRGNWFMRRLTLAGAYDLRQKTRFKHLLEGNLPRYLLDKYIVNLVESETNHGLLGLTPRHSPSEHIPVINDLFPYRVFTGGVVLKGAIKEFTEIGIIFEGEEETVCEVDTVVLATGYVARFAFFDELRLGLKSVESDEYDFYLNMFAMRLRLERPLTAIATRKAIESLVFVGLVQPSGSILVIGELQARLAAMLFAGKIKLPQPKEMIREQTKLVAELRSRAIRSHARDQLVGSWMSYCDELATKIGVRPRMTRLFFQDFSLWRRLMFGPFASYQYRIHGPGSWHEAREMIMKLDDRVKGGINEGRNDILLALRRRRLTEVS